MTLINKSRRVPNLKNRVDDATELSVIDFAIQYPAYGQHSTSNELRKKGVFFQGVVFVLFSYVMI